MAIHTPKTQEQKEFLANVERAQAAGIQTKTSQSVYQAILGGLSYCNFPSGVASLTDEYLVACQDYLRDRAIEMGKDDQIKWVGFE